MTDIEKTIRREIEEAEFTRDTGDEQLIGRGVRRNASPSRMLSVRLPADDFEALDVIARRRDVPVSAVVRGFILTGIAEQAGASLHDAVERVAADVQRLKDMVR